MSHLRLARGETQGNYLYKLEGQPLSELTFPYKALSGYHLESQGKKGRGGIGVDYLQVPFTSF